MSNEVRDLLVEIIHSLETIDSTKELLFRLVWLFAIFAVFAGIVVCIILYDLRNEIFHEFQRNRELIQTYIDFIKVS